MARPKAPKGFAQVRADVGEHMGRTDLLAALAAPDARVQNTSFSALELADVLANGTGFEGVVFRGCAFESVDLSNCTFTDVLFSGCRFVRCDMGRSWLNRCDFRSCSAPGLSLAKARLTGVLFEDCQLGYCDLSDVTAERLRAHETNLTEASVFSSRLRRVELDRCDLARVTVFKTSLSGIDLSSCDLTGIRVSSDLRELRGAIVSPEQAVQLAGLIGVKVKEDDWA